MLFEHEVNRLHERRFVGDAAAFPPPSGGVRAASLVGMAQPCFQPRGLLKVAGMGERTTNTRSLHVMSTGAQQVLSNS